VNASCSDRDAVERNGHLQPQGDDLPRTGTPE